MSKTVSKKMLINVMHPEEARVAIVHDGRLMELNVEISGKEQTKGNIYKGVVLRVEPGLQAAFVDIGRARHGFLQMGELHPDFWQWRDDVPEDQRKRRPRIQEVLRRGQELLVQVEKDERDNKGSALTTYISLPGRYMVIMPGSDSSGISRKVEQEGERKKLKEIMAAMNIPAGIGYIVRTEAVGRTPEELQKDLENLLAQYESIKQSATEISGAGEIYRDRGLIIRTIRDYFSDGIDEVIVDSKEAYNEAREFFRETMPACEKRVKLHKEKRPIFSRFQLEEQIDQIYEKRVALPSGGYLIIEPTEALVSIDVNSGKSSGERGIEDTAFKTNMEAVEEVARQLRLRDLGGLIVIDLIDMRERKHNHEVEKTLKQALKMDKARVNVGRISEFGILEMSRQRIAKTLNDAIHLECPHCEGRGKVKSVEAMALSFLRKVHGAAAKGTVAEVHGGLPLEVAYYLLNRKKRELAQIENDYDISVTVKGKSSFLLNQLELEIFKREKTRPEDLPLHAAEEEERAGRPSRAEVTPEPGAEAEQQREAVPAEGSKKRKRRRKKKKPEGEGAAAAAHPEEQPSEPQPPQELPTELPTELQDELPAELPAELPVELPAELPEEMPAELPEELPSEQPGEPEGAAAAAALAEGDESAATPKKRKRRRGRKPGRGAEEPAAETVEAAPGAEPLPAEAVQTEPAPDEIVAAEPPAAAYIPAEPAPAEPAPEAQPPEQAQTPPPAEKPKRSRTPRPRKKAAPETTALAEAATETAVEPPVAADETTEQTPAPAAKKPRRRPAPKKAVPPDEAEPEKPKAAPRARRKKKTEEIQ